jgi:hypothetical protein
MSLIICVDVLEMWYFPLKRTLSLTFSFPWKRLLAGGIVRMRAVR